MKSKIYLVLTALVFLAAHSFALSAELSPEDSLAVRKAVVAWLECEECEEGELESVVKYGEAAVPTLGAALERGPSPASVEKLRLHLVQSHRNLVEYQRTHDDVKVGLKEDEYVKLYLDNYSANYAVRSARALAKIGGEQAKKYLEGAARLELREDARKAVEEAARGIQK